MKKVIFLLSLIGVMAFAKMNPLVTKGESIIDIGSDHSRFIEVPIERISYTPSMRFVDNMMIYSDRELVEATCIIDGLEHESCPLDKKECAAETQYNQGSATRGEGYISCSQLNVNAYYDATRKKCVLPAGNSKVCKDFAGTTYDSSRDLCVKDVTRALPADLPEIKYGTLWSSGNHDPKGYGINDNLIFLKADFWGYPGDPKPYHCGGKMGRPSPITINERTCYTVPSGIEDVPCTEVSTFGRLPSGGWGMITGCKCVETDWYGETTYTEPDANGMCQQYVVHNGKKDFCDGMKSDGNWQDYKCPGVTHSCNSDEVLSTVNGTNFCTREETFTPKCSGGFFPTRDNSECLGDKLKYDFYAYSCPADLNVYDNPWEVVDPGGDCGEYNLAIDTNGDGIKDRCNAPLPSMTNCERTTYKCSFDPDAICVLDEKQLDYNDFTKWNVVNYNNVEHKDCPNYSGGSWWVVSNKNTVWQKCNGIPTYFLSNYELKDGHITMEGTFKTDDPGDNDWFGFVFGLKDTKNYYLLDMSRYKNDNWAANHDAAGNPTEGAIPLTLSKITGLTSYGPLWSHEDSGTSYKVLQRKDNGGWTKEQEYKIKLDITRNDIKVWIGKVGEPMSLDINYHTDDAMDITGKLGFYNFSISRVTYKDFRIEWVDGEDVRKTFKRPLVTPAQLSGEYKPSEFNVLREGACTNLGSQCLYALSDITGNANKLCFTDKTGRSGCFEAQGGCFFDGIINDFGIKEPPLYSFLNSPDEVIGGYHTNIKKDFDSPTNISLDFTDIPSSNYLLEQVKTEASLGDKITVDFWLYWRGGKGMPVGFNYYDLWITDYLGYFKFGFNTGKGDLYGIKDIGFLKNSWHRITAIFTHGDILQNELYIDGEKQDLSEQHNTRLVHDNTRADITKALQLSGWTVNTNYSLDAKIAGFNVYDGGLLPEQIKRLSTGGSLSGISRLKIDKHIISGYDASDLLLGEINSTCELSGKVGFLGQVIERAETVHVSKDTEVLNQTFDSAPSGWSSSNITNLSGLGSFFGRFGGSAGAESVYKTFDLGEVNAGQNVTINVDVLKIDSWDGEEAIKVFIGGSQKMSLSKYEIMTGTNVGDVSHSLNGGWSTVDSHGASGHEFVKRVSLEATLDSQGKIKIGFGSTLDQSVADESWGIDNLIIELHFDGNITELKEYAVSSPIVAAKAIDNRIEFWNSYEKRGSSGHIEIMKQVAPKDKSEGYKYEFEDLTKLFNEGFTGFKTYSNKMTYATSLNPMTIPECQSYLQGTHYFLAERNSSDVIGLNAIKTFSHYKDGSFGEYCIIQRPGEYDNKHAEYSVLNTVLEKVYTAYFCSPWSCEEHQCGYAECPTDFIGTNIKEADKARLATSTCVDQQCDKNLEYFRYCGNPFGCDTNDYTITETDDGKCKKAECDGDDLFDPNTGTCEKIDCKYVKMDGKCYKKTY